MLGVWVLSTLSIHADDVLEDRRTVGLPRVQVLRRRTVLPTPRAPDGCVDAMSTRVIDYRLSFT
jgi:hypothetical protein